MKEKMVCCVFVLLPMIALADKFNLKPGLWETTSTTEMGGAPTPAMTAMPPEILAKMPPEQRAKMEAMMASRRAGNATTTRSCVTEKTLQRGLMPNTSKEQSCKAESVKTTGTTQEVHVACTSDRGNFTGVYKFTTTSRESYDGTVDLNAVIQNRPMNVKIKLSGKWLSADCGNVKPRDD